MNNKAKLVKTTRNVLAALTIMAGTHHASAFVIGSDVINADGTVTYHFTVDNTAGHFDVAAWSLEFGFPTPDWNQLDNFSGGNVTVPNAGWFADAGTPITGLSSQDFISLDSESDIRAGSSLSGFSFTSSFQPGTISFEEFSANGYSTTGTTIGPVRNVPEGKGPLEAIAFFAVAAYAAVTRGSNSKHNLITNN